MIKVIVLVAVLVVLICSECKSVDEDGGPDGGDFNSARVKREFEPPKIKGCPRGESFSFRDETCVSDSSSSPSCQYYWMMNACWCKCKIIQLRTTSKKFVRETEIVIRPSCIELYMVLDWVQLLSNKKLLSNSN
ncbi:hypothetical protein HELRODRAFT_183424 [Helobdella robusta]|uniref:Thyroglobulin type-1 domain-containing protein n=1 Tax=Helobdella robusta TaxID=6412 RepID=T1FJM4_HELRO|nr:hypothetical protein HELRODRAFT_183424 [Helobdella robusta]ESO11184.1 hypothetical protein HELRODRAFT_183424 [Helobdella robusta]